MKAIIIDDEKHVRDGLLLLADWKRFGINTIFEAKDGEEAVNLINEHQPAIIFTDMRMPKRDGISLLKWIHASGIFSKTIVVSGYDDFEYMRNAIFYKSFDYLLKPIEPDVLNETLEKAIVEWKEEALHQKTLVPNQNHQSGKTGIHLIEEFVRHNYQNEINLQDIADRFFFSREYISRKFKQEFDDTITDYVMKIRMEKAKELLENPHLKIYEVANLVGYQNEKYFSKLFKKLIGVSPNEYRNRKVKVK
ncbi:response regulator [Bacillus timonensis]|uniref:Response regulator n=1 Tax=Bacillus timonensis TaxID=1033734 RepID=A0A4S3PQB4_9BACI|nr:helix-turn-helix domain-containing protein [Bacillus timonensis]THE11405.1 response regulator [Bacillus timonensis]